MKMYMKIVKSVTTWIIILVVLLATAIILNLKPKNSGKSTRQISESIKENDEIFEYEYTAEQYFIPTIRNFVQDNEALYDTQPLTADRKEPLIFIGGFPRSGTTLMRVTLDAHIDISCATETSVIQLILNTLTAYFYSKYERDKYNEIGLVQTVDEGMAKVLMHIIRALGDGKSEHHCVKEPFTCVLQSYLHELFPSSSFILMVRDPRAVLHSIISKQIDIDGINCADYREILTAWNRIMESALTQCVGSERCMMVHYEDMVLQPVKTTKSIFKFIDMKWTPDILYHEKFLLNNQTKLSQDEMRFTSDIWKPLFVEGLSSWFRQIPLDVLQVVPKYAPVMQLLGYNPYDIEPNYGDPDDFVLKKGIWAEEK